jgi:hypothetical protein
MLQGRSVVKSQLDYLIGADLALTPVQSRCQTERMIELVLVLLAFIALDAAALRWGHDSRDLLRPR